MVSNYIITKKDVECFKIRHVSGSYWADIIIDSRENGFRIVISSDFGNWQNYWPVPGMGYSQFLAGLDIFYASGKFGANKQFDHDATMSSLREQIKNLRGKNYRYMMQELEMLTNSIREEDFIVQLAISKHLFGLYPSLSYCIDYGFRRFWNEIWPKFLAALKNEEM